MICKCTEQTPTHIQNQGLLDCLKALPNEVIAQYGGYLQNHPELNNALNHFFDTPTAYSTITPLFIYNELTQELVTILA